MLVAFFSATSVASTSLLFILLISSTLNSFDGSLSPFNTAALIDLVNVGIASAETPLSFNILDSVELNAPDAALASNVSGSMLPVRTACTIALDIVLERAEGAPSKVSALAILPPNMANAPPFRAASNGSPLPDTAALNPLVMAVPAALPAVEANALAASADIPESIRLLVTSETPDASASLPDIAPAA